MSVLVPSRTKMKNSLHHRVDAELNLIPLIDILSVMVAFLLVYSTNVEVVQNAKGIAIPQSSAELQPKQSVVVMVTKDQLFVQGELVANVQEIRDSTDSFVLFSHRVVARPMRHQHGEFQVPHGIPEKPRMFVNELKLVESQLRAAAEPRDDRNHGRFW
jgi:biopolymer transport protein ExbD